MSRPSGWTLTALFARREATRFLRQPAQVAAALGTPALLWLFLGSGIGESFRPHSLETSYAAFLLPGVMTLVAVFSSIFSGLSVIEDRQEGWLQSVLVSPAPRWSIALGRALGGASVAWAQAALLLPLALLLGLRPDGPSVLVILAGLAAASLAMSALSVALAWRTRTSGSFHAVMNLVFMPLWLLSGAFFPPDGAAGWLGMLMRLNPLTWCTSSIRLPLTGAPALPHLLAAAGAAAALTVLAVVVVSSRRGAASVVTT